MLNRIIIMGRLTRDPELRRTQSGISVCSFTVAVDRDFQSRDAQEKQCDFIDCVAWRERAEFICRYFTKGRMIVVDGSLQSRKWVDKTGQNRVSWEIQASTVYFGDSRRDTQNEFGGAPAYGSAPSYNASQGGYSGGGQGGYGGGQGGYSGGGQSGYGGGQGGGYGSQQSYGSTQGGYGGGAAAYDAPADSYAAPSDGGFAELEEDGELPF